MTLKRRKQLAAMLIGMADGIYGDQAFRFASAKKMYDKGLEYGKGAAKDGFASWLTLGDFVDTCTEELAIEWWG